MTVLTRIKIKLAKKQLNSYIDASNTVTTGARGDIKLPQPLISTGT